MSRRILKHVVVCFCVLVMFAPAIQATYVYPIEIFTNNGAYFNSPEINLYVEVSQLLPEQIDFTFHNESQIESCIAEIYFDNDIVLSSPQITNSQNTLFTQPAKPANLPAGNTLVPSFATTDWFSFDSSPPGPVNGINQYEWLKITFDMETTTSFDDIIAGMNAGLIRIGAHIIALPDGSSESAVTVPEPATICLLGLASLALFQRRKK